MTAAPRLRPSPATPRRVPDVADLQRVGREAGLDAVGVAPAEPFVGTRHDLDDRKAAGLHGGMAFTYRNPARSTEPHRIVADARALVVGARSYLRQELPAPTSAGRVARYAWGDRYDELRQALGLVAAALHDAGWRAVVVADDNALVDREAAHRAGLGWYGKNANLLLPGRGSWFVLGSVVTDAPLPPSAGPVADGCGSCRRCIDGCPTGAIVAPGVVDARRCLAWLVQAPGPFPLEHREALGDRLYGCDDCQEVCPPNRRETARDEHPPPGGGDEPWVDLVALLATDDEELLARHGRWYIAERDPRHLRRNALIALGNVGDPTDARVLEAVERHRLGDDALLAEHAGWAADRLRERAARAAESGRS